MRFSTSRGVPKLTKMEARVQLASTWGELGPTWLHTGQLEANLGQLGANLEPTWGLFGPTSGNFGPPWGQLGSTWAGLGQLRPARGQSGPQLGPCLRQLGPMLGLIWRNLGSKWRRPRSNRQPKALSEITGQKVFSRPLQAKRTRGHVQLTVVVERRRSTGQADLLLTVPLTIVLSLGRSWFAPGSR